MTALNWCELSRPSTLPHCEVNVRRIFFGKSLLENEIEQVQDLSVLIGLQGSGMMNGLYLSPYTTVVVYYLNDGWPISSGDPLELITARGPYLRHINKDPMKIICPLSNDKVIPMSSFLTHS
jgi:hypothetical protein